MYVRTHTRVQVSKSHSTGMEVREQPLQAGSPLPLCGIRGLKSGSQACVLVTLPTDPSCWSFALVLKTGLMFLN